MEAIPYDSPGEFIGAAIANAMIITFWMAIGVWIVIGIALHIPCSRITRIGAVIIVLMMSLFLTDVVTLAPLWAMVLSLVYLMSYEAFGAR